MLHDDKASINKKVGLRIKEARKSRGLTLAELGNKIGLSESNTQRYESGRISSVSVELINKIAKALNVSPAFLMGWEDDNNVVPILARSVSERDELISLQRNYKDLGEDQREKLQSYLEFLRSQKPSMPEDDDID